VAAIGQLGPFACLFYTPFSVQTLQIACHSETILLANGLLNSIKALGCKDLGRFRLGKNLGFYQDDNME